MKLYKIKPRKLTLQEVHSLYLLLRHCLPQKEELLLVDEIEKMIGAMENGEVLVKALEILYPNKKINRNNPLELLVMFVRGLKQNEFFEYVSFINAIKHGR